MEPPSDRPHPPAPERCRPYDIAPHPPLSTTKHRTTRNHPSIPHPHDLSLHQIPDRCGGYTLRSTACTPRPVRSPASQPPALAPLALLTLAFLLSPIAEGTVTGAFSAGSLSDNIQIQHVVQSEAGDLYVGATNRIFRLSSDLSVVEQTTTGPRKDNIHCLAAFVNENDACWGLTTEYTKVETDNVNKVLLVDESRGMLVVCGTLYQGGCYQVPLSDVDAAWDPQGKVEMVAANTLDASTAALLAPGPPNPLAGSVVLYVATTLGGDLDIRGHEVPAVASRKLDDGSFRFASDDTASSGRATFLKYENKACREDYPVDFRAAFYHAGYAYFVAVQRQVMCTGAEPFVSKIVQVCAEDVTYTSYMEMGLGCGDYNVVQGVQVINASMTLAQAAGVATGDALLVAIFSRSADATTSDVTSQSAVCIYPMRDVRARFEQNTQACYTGTGQLAPHLHEAEAQLQCVDTTMTASGFTPASPFCGHNFKTNLAMLGSSPLTAEPLYTHATRTFTGVASSNVNDYTVFFIGTGEGTVLKVFFFATRVAHAYDEVTVEAGAPILRDMLLDRATGRDLVVPTGGKVYKVATSTCGSHLSCDSCLSAFDPHCGWCALSAACTSREGCPEAALPQRWIAMTQSTCPAVTDVLPAAMDVAATSSIDVTVARLPYAGGETYSCMRDAVEFAASVIDKSAGVIRCTQPAGDVIPAIPDDADHVTSTLGVKSHVSGVTFVMSDVTFYSCSVHPDCVSCTQARFNCRWCTYSNRCSFSQDGCQSNMAAVSSSDGCPVIIQQDSPKIRVPVDYPTAFELTARNLPIPLQSQGGYECLVELTTPPLRVPATRLSAEQIRCDATTYTLPRDVTDGERPADVSVVWNTDFAVQQRLTTLVYVYSCEELVEDCGQCLSVQAQTPEYGCAWCNSSCRYEPQCAGTPAHSECPNPIIESVTPQTGPLEGGTRVTITGSNLGSSYEQVVGSVAVAGQPCVVDSAGYLTSRTIVCITGRVSRPTAGMVVLALGDVSVEFASFKYQDPQLESMTPSRGPRDGGTLISLRGMDLNTGSELSVLVGSLGCSQPTIVSSTEVQCLTSAVGQLLTMSTVTVMFDGAVRELAAPYTYTDNPTISSIKPLTAFIAGGRDVTVRGTHLDVVQKPQMALSSGDFRSDPTTCIVVNATMIRCPSPQVPSEWVSQPRQRRSRPTVLSVTFIMDGVTSVADVAAYFPGVVASFSVMPDPIYYSFPDGQETYAPESGFLVLAGQDLDLASTVDEVEVSVGAEPCIVDSLSENKLLCAPPAEQPLADGLPRVMVRVGNLVYDLGAVKYADQSSELPLFVIIAIAAGGGVFIIIIISILIVYQRRSKEAQRQMKKMLLQMDMLESNVRNECKQAFAELQTEVSDLTSDLSMSGIPFWDYHTYSFKVLFPGHNDHPILHGTQNEFTSLRGGGMEQGLQQFHQLLNSKQFLVIFIRTLESQKNFSIRDRANVASFLMVVLQDKMEYATEILKALLNELIDKSVEKKNPKLLFRRTESVVEKLLTNWLSLCMYDYLKKHAGRHLYILYKAIKHQTEKGPVDAITAEARYSLSEDRLLREKIEPNILNVFLYVENQEPISCKLLDCDTITQAKEKALDAIYMNTPHSRRPSVYDVDLEVRSGRSGHLPLQDEDVTTKMEKGWKRVNTLAHYNLADGSLLALVPKRFKNEYVRNVHGMVEITSGSLTALSPIITVEEGTRVWHLVQHDEHQQQSRAQKVISEIFLTRLLTTKGTMQQYVDDLFLSVLKVDKDLPAAVKFLFDFLDTAARRHNIIDPDVVHTWKSNSLPLRFWVNILKNPEFSFDIHKSHIVDSCLSVVAQTFMDACSTSEHRLGKDSPTNKLLFAKDIPKYRKWVERYYADVAEAMPVSDQDMHVAMTELSLGNRADFNLGSALKELYRYAAHYNYELLEALDNDPSAKKLHLAHKFDQINAAIDGHSLYQV